MADLQPTLGSSQKKIRKRGSNYTVSETVIIEEEYLKNRWLLEGKFSDKVTNARKQQVWEMITQKVNAAGSKVRTVEKIKEKWRAEMEKSKEGVQNFHRRSVEDGWRQAPSRLVFYDVQNNRYVQGNCRVLWYSGLRKPGDLWYV
jgi:hypothetical protein